MSWMIVNLLTSEYLYNERFCREEYSYLVYSKEEIDIFMQEDRKFKLAKFKTKKEALNNLTRTIFEYGSDFTADAIGQVVHRKNIKVYNKEVIAQLVKFEIINVSKLKSKHV